MATAKPEFKEVALEQIEAAGIRADPGLCTTVERYGVRMPVILYPIGDGRYGIAGGRRRIDALRRAGAETVTAMIVDPEEADDLTILENLQRSPNPAAEALALQRKVEGGMSRQDVARAFGIGMTKLKQRLALLDLHQALFDRLWKGDLSARAAYKARALPENLQVELAGKEGPILQTDIEEALRSLQASVTARIEIPPMASGRELAGPVGMPTNGEPMMTLAEVRALVREVRDAVTDVDAPYAEIWKAACEAVLNRLSETEPMALTP